MFNTDDYETLYRQVRESEVESKELLLEFDHKYPNTWKDENIDSIISVGRSKHAAFHNKDALLARLLEAKAKEREINESNEHSAEFLE